MIEVKNLTKSFGNKMIIDGLSFVISEGQKIGFIGRNGSGKSTLFRIITGEEEQDAGEVNKTVADRKPYWYKDAKVKFQLSPRLGIAFPITDKGVIHFSYGHFFQHAAHSLARWKKGCIV